VYFKEEEEKEEENLQRPITFNQKEIKGQKMITEGFFSLKNLTVLYKFRIV